jgi:hypothetical protein
MTCERAVLGEGQLQSQVQRTQHEHQGETGDNVSDRINGFGPPANVSRGLYCRLMTLR